MNTTIKIALFIILLSVFSCKDKNKPTEEEPPVNTTPTNPATNAYGFNVLKKLRGIWNGPVTSTTPLGDYPEWIVDFRPNAENQISAKNELDTLNDIFMSFFIAKYNNQEKIAFRNGGSFGGTKRVSYFLADSVSENGTTSFYRFCEIIKGKTRAYTEIIFRADSLYIRSYTNKTNSQPTSVPHMTWSAKLQDSTSAQATITNLAFPKNTITKDLTSSFTSLSEAIFFSTTGNPIGDPYPESAQPYLGKTIAIYNYASTYTPNPAKKVFLVITTQALFSGFTFNTGNLKYRSRYVILNASSTTFTFNYMHPGSYYYYAFYDNDANNIINSGDWISTANTPINLSALGTTTVNTQINFTIP